MNTGQMMLTIGALGLLSFAILNLNWSLSENDVSLAQNRYRLEALSLINSFIEQATMYYFDEATTDTNSAKQLLDFTHPNLLGKEVNDSSNIDDFDDFNDDTTIVSGLSSVEYKVWFKVDYVVLSGDSLTTSPNRSYYKRMRVFVTDNYPDPLLYRNVGGDKERDTLSISFVNSYWFYR